jgi:hypothetical protein
MELPEGRVRKPLLLRTQHRVRPDPRLFLHLKYSDSAHCDGDFAVTSRMLRHPGPTGCGKRRKMGLVRASEAVCRGEHSIGALCCCSIA